MSDDSSSDSERPCLHCLRSLTIVFWDGREPLPPNPGRCVHCGRTWPYRIFTYAGGHVPEYIRQRCRVLAGEVVSREDRLPSLPPRGSELLGETPRAAKASKERGHP